MSRPTILVIDEDASRRARLVKMLAQFAQVTTAAHAVDAVRVARMVRPDVVIVDLIRSRSGGTALARTLKSDDHNRAIVAIAASPAELPSLSDGQFVAALAQPFDRDELIDLVFGLGPSDWRAVSKRPHDASGSDGKTKGARAQSAPAGRADTIWSRMSPFAWLLAVVGDRWLTGAPIR